MELSPSITTFPASLDACEEREDDEWRPVPIKFMGLRTRAGDGQESGLELRYLFELHPVNEVNTKGQ